jgi:hypothetical protein
LGAEADVNGRADALAPDGKLQPAEVRWPSPLALWPGILAAPLAWAIDLTASYALAKWNCLTGRSEVLHGIMMVSLATVAGGAIVSSIALRRTAGDVLTDGGRPRERARFMTVLGLAISALIALQIVATAIPEWVLDACE